MMESGDPPRASKLPAEEDDDREADAMNNNNPMQNPKTPVTFEEVLQLGARLARAGILYHLTPNEALVFAQTNRQNWHLYRSCPYANAKLVSFKTSDFVAAAQADPQPVTIFT